jgi:hypothetical protein
MDSIPVLAKAGGIVPMEQAASVSSRTDNPKKLLIKIFCGADGDFSLYEDDGISMEYEQENYVTTEMALCWGETKIFTIEAAQGKTDLIPQSRDYELEFYGVSQDAVEQVLSGEEMKTYQTGYDEERHILTVSVSDISVEKPLTVRLRSEEQLQENDIAALAYYAINRAQIPFAEKEQLYRILTGDMDREGKLSTVESMFMPEEMKSVVREILLAF